MKKVTVYLYSPTNCECYGDARDIIYRTPPSDSAIDFINKEGQRVGQLQAVDERGQED